MLSVKDNIPLGKQKYFDEEYARDGRQRNRSHLNNSRCRYMAEILPIRRKTLSNQTINHHKYMRNVINCSYIMVSC